MYHDTSPGLCRGERRGMDSYKQIKLLDILKEYEEQEEKRVQAKPEEVLLSLIPVGSKNAIKRNWLCKLAGMIDRNMRIILHEARKKIPVINLQNGMGYFIPDMNNENDVYMLIRWVKQEKSRIKESQLIVDAAIRTLENCGIDWR